MLIRAGFVLAGYFQGKRNAEHAMAEAYPDQGVSLRPGFIHGTRYVSGFGIPLGFIGEGCSCALFMSASSCALFDFRKRCFVVVVIEYAIQRLSFMIAAKLAAGAIRILADAFD